MDIVLTLLHILNLSTVHNIWPARKRDGNSYCGWRRFIQKVYLAVLLPLKLPYIWICVFVCVETSDLPFLCPPSTVRQTVCSLCHDWSRAVLISPPPRASCCSWSRMQNTPNSRRCCFLCSYRFNATYYHSAQLSSTLNAPWRAIILRFWNPVLDGYSPARFSALQIESKWEPACLPARSENLVGLWPSSSDSQFRQSESTWCIWSHECEIFWNPVYPKQLVLSLGNKEI